MLGLGTNCLTTTIRGLAGCAAAAWALGRLTLGPFAIIALHRFNRHVQLAFLNLGVRWLRATVTIFV